MTPPRAAHHREIWIRGVRCPFSAAPNGSARATNRTQRIGRNQATNYAATVVLRQASQLSRKAAKPAPPGRPRSFIRLADTERTCRIPAKGAYRESHKGPFPVIGTTVHLDIAAPPGSAVGTPATGARPQPGCETRMRLSTPHNPGSGAVPMTRPTSSLPRRTAAGRALIWRSASCRPSGSLVCFVPTMTGVQGQQWGPAAFPAHRPRLLAGSPW